MNTNQLIVLWYGGLAFLAAFLSNLGPGVTMAVGLAVLVLLFLTGWHHSHHAHRLNHRKLMVAIVLPSCLIGILTFMADTTEYDVGLPPPAVLEEISSQEIQLVDPKFHHRFFLDRLSGQIKNNSPKTLNQLKLHVTLYDDSGLLEEFDATVKNLNIPPGQTGSFSQTVGDPRARLKKDVKWTYQVLSARGKA